VDDFEAVKVTAWEGVRNYEARNLMIQMKVGDKVSRSACGCYSLSPPVQVLFYHSNCKNPGRSRSALV
jgi:predicted RNA-binding protein with PUA-like domain